MRIQLFPFERCQFPLVLRLRKLRKHRWRNTNMIQQLKCKGQIFLSQTKCVWVLQSSINCYIIVVLFRVLHSEIICPDYTLVLWVRILYRPIQEKKEWAHVTCDEGEHREQSTAWKDALKLTHLGDLVLAVAYIKQCV